MADTLEVNDHGLEVLKKAAVPVQAGYKNQYRLRTTGTFTYSGLSERFKTSTIEVSTTAVKIPATPLTNRNHIEIHNKSGTKTLYIADNDQVTADTAEGTTSGKEIPPGSFFNIDITPDIELYGIIESGTMLIKVTEVA